jgi:hypothetical protein
MRIAIALVAVLYWSLVAPAMAQDSTVFACDKLTADAIDPDRVSAPTLLQDINPSAIKICSNDFKKSKHLVRLKYQLERAKVAQVLYYDKGTSFNPSVLQQLAKANHIPSLILLGTIYGSKQYNGYDLKKVRKYYLKAASLGSDFGKAFAGEILVLLPKNPKDRERGLALLHEMAGKSIEHSQYALGWDYEFTVRDYDKAIYWYKKAFLGGFPRAFDSLKQIYQTHRSDQFSNNLLHAWLQEGHAAGNDFATVGLAIQFREGIHIKQDLLRAKSLLESIDVRNKRLNAFVARTILEIGNQINKQSKEK